MLNKTLFSVTVEDFQKLMFYSLYYPYQIIPGVPVMKLFTKLIGDPIIHRQAFGLPKGCPNVDLNNAEGINMIKSDNGNKSYDSLHIPLIIKALEAQRPRPQPTKSTTKLVDEDTQLKVLIFRKRKDNIQIQLFKSPVKSEFQSPRNKSPNFKKNMTVNPESSTKKLKNQVFQFTNIHDFTFCPQSKYDTFNTSQQRNKFLSPQKQSFDFKKRNYNPLDKSFMEFRDTRQISMSKSLQRL